MILCVCKRVTEQQVDSVVAKGARTVGAVSQATGAGTDCGACVKALADRVCARESPTPDERDEELPLHP